MTHQIGWPDNVSGFGQYLQSYAGRKNRKHIKGGAQLGQGHDQLNGEEQEVFYLAPGLPLNEYTECLDDKTF